MQKIQQIWNRYKKYCLIIGGIVIISISLIIYLGYSKEEKTKDDSEEIAIVEEKEEVEEESLPSTFYVDIKGYVKNPGVYEVSDGTIVNDVIKLAGGVTKKGTTKNINLSRPLSKSMVIIIKSEKDLKKEEPVIEECICEEVEITTCIENNNTSVITSSDDINNNTTVNTNPSDTLSTTKISINTASLQELMNLPGVGESKAQSIIDYRNINGPFSTIEDIQNVSGIGEALFAKIKENITT